MGLIMWKTALTVFTYMRVVMEGASFLRWIIVGQPFRKVCGATVYYSNI